MLTPTSWYSKSFRGCSFCVIAKTFFSLDLIDFEVRMLPVGLMKPFFEDYRGFYFGGLEFSGWVFMSWFSFWNLIMLL